MADQNVTSRPGPIRLSLRAREALSVIGSQFALNTTTHGYLKTCTAKGKRKQVFWSALMFTTYSMLAGHLAVVTMRYLSRPVAISVVMKQSQQLDFPAITVCNMNPVRRDAWEEMKAERLGKMTTKQAADVEVTGTRTRKATAPSDTQRLRKKRDTGCRPGWELFGINATCYKAFIGKFTLEEARTICAEAGSLIATPRNEEEQGYLHDIADNLGEDIWLGLKTDYRWNDNTKVNITEFSNLANLESQSDGDCFYLKAPNYTWEDGDCSTLRGILCEIPASSSICEDEGTYFNRTGHCYWTLRGSWPLGISLVVCMSHLIFIETAAEQEFVVNITRPTFDYWLGMTRSVTRDDGLDSRVYRNWQVRGPKYLLACHVLTANTTTGTWSEENCHNTHSFVCQLEATSETFTESPTPTTAKTAKGGETTLTEHHSASTTTSTTTMAEVSTNLEKSSAQSTESPIKEQSSSTEDEIRSSSITTSLLKHAYTSTTEARRSTSMTEVIQNIPSSATTLSTIESSTEENMTTITTTTTTTTATTTMMITTFGENSSRLTTAALEIETESTIAISTTETTQNATEPTNTDLGFPTSRSVQDWSPTVEADPNTIGLPSSKECLTETRTEAISSDARSELPVTEHSRFSCPEITDEDGCYLDTGEAVTSDVLTDASDELTTDESTSVTSPDVSTSATATELPLVKSYLEAESVLDTLAALTDDQKAEVGHQRENFIVDCQFAGVDCDCSEFAIFQNPVYGNCFMFNSGWNGSVKQSYKTGSRHGLTLILNVEQDQYLEQFGDTVGARIVIHEPRIMPFPEDEGIFVQPGKATYVGIKRVVTEQLPHPFGSCVETTERSNAVRNQFPAKYSFMACMKACYQQNAVETCGCQDPYLPLVINVTDGIGTREICRSSDIYQVQCLKEVHEAIDRQPSLCHCEHPCRWHDYSLTLSKAAWPSDIAEHSVIKRLFPNIRELFTEPSDISRYRRNLIKVEIFYETFDHEMIAEEPAYELQRYLSNVGGILGLWLGCSVLSLFEYIELVIDLCTAVLAKRHSAVDGSTDRCRSGRGTALTERRARASGISEHDQKILVTVAEPERERWQYIFKETVLERQLLAVHRLRHNNMIQY